MTKFTRESKAFNPGLIWFVIFTIGFLLLRSTVLISLIFGVLGGVAVGLVTAWWNNELLLNPNKRPKEKPSDAIVNKEVVESKSTYYASGPKREASTLFDWLSAPENKP